MKTLGVMANCGKPSARPALRQLAAWARKRGWRLRVADETARLLPGAQKVRPARLASRLDALVVLGGDGTLLRAARLLGGADVPILGVNLGSLGFLTSVTYPEMERALDHLAGHRFRTSVRSIMECRLLRKNRVLGRYRALNDVVIGWGESSRVVTLGAQLDGEPLGVYLCDGLIVATPTGSTGHALSAGGPILRPECDCFVLCAICPHTLSHRPLVFSDRRELVIEITRAASSLLLSVDGQEEQSVRPGDRLEIRKAERGVRLIQLPDYSYSAVLRQKLNWRGSSL